MLQSDTIEIWGKGKEGNNNNRAKSMTFNPIDEVKVTFRTVGLQTRD